MTKYKSHILLFLLLCSSVPTVYFFYSSSSTKGQQNVDLDVRVPAAMRTTQKKQNTIKVPPATSLQGTAVADSGADPATISTSSLNPGCSAKKLNKYRSLDKGQVYNHPPIIHYARLSHSASTFSLNFREYTSILSAFKFLQPKRIIFHVYTGTRLTGKYWEVINKWQGVEVEVNAMAPVRYLSGKRVGWIQHEADYIKLREVYRSGGVAMDFDVVIVNGSRLKHQQRLSECVLSEEGEYINGGYYSCIEHSAFLKKWLEGYETDYRPELWLHNVSFKPRDLLLQTDVCYNVHLDDTICIHPNWGKQRDWLGSGVEWRSKTAAHYFVKSNIRNDGEGLLKESSSLAQLIQYVHAAA